MENNLFDLLKKNIKQKKYIGIFDHKIDALDAYIDSPLNVSPYDMDWALSKPGEYELTKDEIWLQFHLGKEKFESILDERQCHFKKNYLKEKPPLNENNN
tara:strand:+ start:504 stop:803 length:300 start_codon:yes stop_codon:yes gene_type:complete